MWASKAKCAASCSARIRSLDWQDSSEGRAGWLATACGEGDVGISWIDSSGLPDDAASTEAAGANLAYTDGACMYKSHLILKGHAGEVLLVRWMPNGDRLASYDSWGKIISWRNRVNILVSDFQISVPFTVTDMQWSPCGYYLFICGRDGHIQMYSGVSGLNLFTLQVQAISPLSSKPSFTCCAWNLPRTRIALGARSGEIIMLSPQDNGAYLSTMAIRRGVPLQSIQWYGPVDLCQTREGASYESQSLFALLKNGNVVLFDNLSGPGYITTETGVCSGFASWNSANTLLAVVGYKSDLSSPLVRFLNSRGYVIYSIAALPPIPRAEASIHGISWGLKDSTLFITQGSSLYTMEVEESLPSLYSLCQRVITDELMGDSSEEDLLWLPLPIREIKKLQKLKSPLVPLPFATDRLENLDSLFKPLAPTQRLHCVLESSESLPGYTLKYEHLNCYIPLLQARRTAGKLLTNCFIIEPAFSCSQQSQEKVASRTDSPVQEGEFWAHHVESPYQHDLPLPLSRNTAVLRNIRSVLRPTHRQVSQQGAAAATRVPQQPKAELKRTLPVLAEIEGNRITNRYNFSTELPLFQNGSLGSVNIFTSYVRLKPRKLSVVLSDGSEETLYSKEPVWNYMYNLYELDFGGRVNRDSIKNFQVERKGEVVLQFGRTHSQHFCLDFQAPFSPVQALCVAVACLL